VRKDPLDFASLAAALDPLVSEIMHIGDIPGHLFILLRDHVLVHDGSKFSIEGFDGIAVVVVLMALRIRGQSGCR
jgi:hypothetical protein